VTTLHEAGFRFVPDVNRRPVQTLRIPLGFGGRQSRAMPQLTSLLALTGLAGLALVELLLHGFS